MTYKCSACGDQGHNSRTCGADLAVRDLRRDTISVSMRKIPEEHRRRHFGCPPSPAPAPPLFRGSEKLF